MNDPSQQPRLEAYVKDLISTFANDTRVLGWDVFNEPPCNGHETQGLLDLLTNVFAWCRSVDPIQPCTSPLFSVDVDTGDLSKYHTHSLIQLNNSDVITFHE
jgi:endo-1,4-beta-mannosidase